MAYIKTFLAATARGALVLLAVCSLQLLALGDSPVGAAAVRTPVATSLRAITSGETTLIEISGTAPMPFTVRRPDARQLVVELPGVDASQLSASYSVSSPLVASVAVKRALRGGDPGASLEVSLRAPVRERSRLEGSQLVVELTPEASDASAAEGGAQARPAPSPASPNQTPQASQGSQYGQPGFAGEPINLNVVNADIRDILNYITEQYGVNFVIDSSVGAVPVTVNVTDVPWNVALDAILRANRLGVDANGNILRIATIEVLSNEAAAQEKINDARLNNSPLITEFIRLNYARASGTLAQAAGSTGGFAGGATNLSFSGGAGGDATGGGGDQGLLPIIKRRLSRRGAIESYPSSNTLIVTDVRENIEAIRQLVAIL